MSTDDPQPCCRVLKDDGVFLSITFAQPHFRRPFLLAERYAWGMEVASFGEGFHYFLYCMRKGARKASDSPSHFAARDPEEALESNQGAGQATESSMHEHMDSADYILSMDV